MNVIDRVRENRQGFTLIELLAAFAILGLVMLATLSIVISAMRIFDNNAEARGNKLIADTICQAITEELKYAQRVSLLASDAGEPSYENSFSIRVGWLYRNGEAVYAEVLGDMTLGLRAIAHGPAIEVIVDLYNEEGELCYVSANTVRVNMLHMFMGSISGVQDEMLTNPLLSFE